MRDFLVPNGLNVDKGRVKEKGFTNLTPTAIKIFQNSRLPYARDVVSPDAGKSRKAVDRLVDSIFSG